LPAVSLAGPWFDFLILGRVGMGLFERLHLSDKFTSAL
jgi:hypothetical protein